MLQLQPSGRVSKLIRVIAWFDICVLVAFQAYAHRYAVSPDGISYLDLSDAIVKRDKLTTLMVTHSMHQAASLGDRLIMMHRGQIIHDFQGAEKRRLRPEDLLARFEEVRRAEQLDESAAAMLAENYV